MQGLFYIERNEAEQILISVIAIAFAFSIALTSTSVMLNFPKEFIIFTAMSVVTVGIGFIFHEMAHKLVAIHYGAYARFQMWMQGIVFMLIAAVFLGFLFAAPGAVYIYSNNISRKENGIISIAGPLTNVIIAFVFVLLAIIAPVRIPFSFMQTSLNVWAFGAQINLILAIFNMLPMFPLDGSKVLAWDKLAWALFVLFCFGFGLIFRLISFETIVMYLILMAFSLLLSGFLFRR